MAFDKISRLINSLIDYFMSFFIKTKSPKSDSDNKYHLIISGGAFIISRNAKTNVITSIANNIDVRAGYDEENKFTILINDKEYNFVVIEANRIKNRATINLIEYPSPNIQLTTDLNNNLNKPSFQPIEYLESGGKKYKIIIKKESDNDCQNNYLIEINQLNKI